MGTLRTNTMLWVWEECLDFSKTQPDLNLSIVFFTLTLFGAPIRRCHNFWPVIDTFILPTLRKARVVMGFFSSGTQTDISTKEVDFVQKQDWVIMARHLFSCSLGHCQEENLLFLVFWSSGSSCDGSSHSCTSHFMLSSDVTWALPIMWICAQIHPRQMQYLEWWHSYYC